MNDIDQLIEKTSVEQVLAHYGKPLPEKASGGHRMQCVFNESCADSQYGNLTVKLNDTVNRIYCHTCGVRGNLLTLLHGLETHQPPTGGRLRGDEFKNAVAKLREISGQPADSSGNDQRPLKNTSGLQSAPDSKDVPPAPKITNTPLHRHEKEAARELADLYNDLIVDVSGMSPEAAQYIRKRPWMTPELMKKWGVGWIPGNGRSLFRKTYLVFARIGIEMTEVLLDNALKRQFVGHFRAARNSSCCAPHWHPSHSRRSFAHRNLIDLLPTPHNPCVCFDRHDHTGQNPGDKLLPRR